ncbi:MAG: methionyl-tRNA formyltransferase [Robiginitomaculum sp.]
MRVVFMGTPEFAVASLSEIIGAGHDVTRVYSQPPRRAGRGKSLRKSPVHNFAESMGIEVRTPESFLKKSVIDDLENLETDVACVVAYGKILPQRALDAPKYGSLNLHGSKLPRWRGAAPIQRVIMAGDTETAAQIMQMEKGLDMGPILLSETISLARNETAGSLHDKLARIGAMLWPRALAALERGALTPTPQSGEPTYAAKIDKTEARLDFLKPAAELERCIRGLSPFPGAWCELPTSKKTVRVKVHLAQLEDKRGAAGAVLDDNLLIACGEKSIRLLRVQPSGKGQMSAEDYVRGHPCEAGQILL